MGDEERRHAESERRFTESDVKTANWRGATDAKIDAVVTDVKDTRDFIHSVVAEVREVVKEVKEIRTQDVPKLQQQISKLVMLGTGIIFIGTTLISIGIQVAVKLIGH